MSVYNYSCSRCGASLCSGRPLDAGTTILCGRCSSTTREAEEPTYRVLEESPRARPRRAKKLPVASVAGPTEPLPPRAPGEDWAWERQQKEQRRRMFALSLIAMGGLVCLFGIIFVISLLTGGSGKDKAPAPKDAAGGEERRPGVVWPPDEEELPRPTDRRFPRREEEEEPPRRPRDDWAPDFDRADRLGRETRVGPYRLRPPRDYRLDDRTGPAGAEEYVWTGDRRDDLTEATFKVKISRPPTDDGIPSLEEALDAVLAPIRRKREDWRQKPVERGRLGGLSFVRTHWTGFQQGTDTRVHGFCYVGRDGRTFVELSWQDVAPHHTKSREIAEAAALTFRAP